MHSKQNKNQSIGLFVTCLADLFRPSVASATVRLLQQQGFAVSVPAQSCCGQPAYNSGEKSKTTVLAKQFVEQFESFDYIVAPSGSCAAMVKVHYPGLFDTDERWTKRSQQVADKTYELSQFLTQFSDIDPACSENWQSNTFTYHDSCSGLRELGVSKQPRDLLKRYCGLEISEMENSEICCGFGGTFCVKFPEISTRMVNNKISGLETTDADLLLGGDLGCLMNIAGRLKRQGKTTRVYHYAEVLANHIVDHGIAENKIVESAE